MDAIDLNDYVSGGYYIGAYTSDPNNIDAHLPERIVSISDCRGDVVRVSSLMEYDEAQSNYLVRQGVPKTKQELARTWYSEHWRDEISFPDGFYSLSTAKQFMAEYIQVQKDIFIVGIGLHKSFSEEFIAGNDKNIARDISDKSFEKFQLTRNVPFGLNKMIRQKGTLEDGGHILGYELVTYVVGFICSYLCTCDQFDMIEKFNTYPNSYGLIDRFDIATEVRKWRGSDDNYFPWLIVQYPIT